MLSHPSFRLAGKDMAGTSVGIGAWGLVTGVAATAAIAAFALPLKLNILVAIAAAVAVGLLIEAVEHHRNPPELLLVPAEEDLPADEQQHVRDGDVVPVREERHP